MPSICRQSDSYAGFAIVDASCIADGTLAWEENLPERAIDIHLIASFCSFVRQFASNTLILRSTATEFASLTIPSFSSPRFSTARLIFPPPLVSPNTPCSSLTLARIGALVIRGLMGASASSGMVKLVVRGPLFGIIRLPPVLCPRLRVRVEMVGMPDMVDVFRLNDDSACLCPGNGAFSSNGAIPSGQLLSLVLAVWLIMLGCGDVWKILVGNV